MTKEQQEEMWRIDAKANLGDFISETEKEWFNEHFEEMRELMEDNYNHWKNHSAKL